MSKRLIYVLLLLLASGVWNACTENSVELPDVEDCEHYSYSDCNTVEPVDAPVRFIFTINNQIHHVIFTVYRGTIDEGSVFFTDTTSDSDLDYYLDVNEYYSAIATYEVDGKQIKVVDGGKLVKASKKVCDSVCWNVNDLVLDLSIRQ